MGVLERVGFLERSELIIKGTADPNLLDTRNEAVRQLEQSLPLAKPVPVLCAHIIHTLAEALTRRGGEGDIERAKGKLQECLTLLEEMGDTRKADRVRAELTSLR